MWKLAKKGIESAFGSWAKLTHLKGIAIEENMFHVLDFSTLKKKRKKHTHTYHKYLNHPVIYRTRPSSSGHEPKPTHIPHDSCTKALRPVSRPGQKMFNSQNLDHEVEYAQRLQGLQGVGLQLEDLADRLPVRLSQPA
eukprot:1139970-Pelagomonas_calceolata.AAC.1